MKQKSLKITLIICAVLAAVLLLAIVLLSAKSGNTAPGEGNETLNVQQDSSSVHHGSPAFTDRDYCTLDSIMVGTHECSPSKSECTDCQSFARK